MNLSTTIETKDLENKLRIFSTGLGDIFTELLETVGKEMVNEVKSRVMFQNRTGRLFNSINFILDKENNKGILTTRKSLNKSNAWYANIIEHGANIKPKNKEYLMFKINGEWKKVKSVNVKPRPFMKDVFYDYFGNNGKGYKVLADELIKKIDRELN